MDMLIIGTRSPLFGYRHNKTSGKLISQGAGPGGSALTLSESRAQLSMWTILKSPLLASADFLQVPFSLWRNSPHTFPAGPYLIRNRDTGYLCLFV